MRITSSVITHSYRCESFAVSKVWQLRSGQRRSCVVTLRSISTSSKALLFGQLSSWLLAARCCFSDDSSVIGGTNFRRLVALKDALASPCSYYEALPCDSRFITQGTVHCSIAALPESRAMRVSPAFSAHSRNQIVLRANCESCLVAVSR